MTQSRTATKVKSSALMGFYPLCRELKINPVKILAAEGLSSAVLRSPDLMIAYESLAHVLNHAADTADYPLFGIAMARYQDLKTFGPLGLLAAQTHSVAESLEVIQKYFHFHAHGASINLLPPDKEQRTHLNLEIHLAPSISQEQLLEMSLVFGYNILSDLAPEFATATEIHFRHERVAPLEQYQALTQARLCFGQEKDALVFPACLLSRPPSPAPEEVRNYLEAFLAQESQGHEQPLQYKVSRLIYELIPTGEATLTTIAPMLGMNVRTLQRELRQNGTEFRTLLDEVRFDIARGALEQNHSITDVALNLGYSELSAFSRAFKRWSGVPPQQWRQVSHPPTF